MPLKDPEARREYHKNYLRRRYREDPEYREKHRERTDRVNDRVREEVDRLIAAFRSNGCSLCPEKETCCLAAHHLDGGAKDFAIANGRLKRYSVARMKKELAKCVCVCHNCHSKIHATVL